MPRQFDVIVERDADGWLVASVPALPGCHTQAKSLDKLMVRIREAAELCMAAEGREASDLEFVGIQRMIVEA
ncbi:MAG: type II toxin-antitoxin system HicB family antitoxin [Alphaproteobacteria bacterium]|nr:type II toxin-antitoxin system HicB family antitoxin [Alphaproteobacteria bacterium]